MPFLVLSLTVVAGVLLLLTDSTAAAAPPVTRAKLVHAYPHDPASFCQGLVVHEGKLLEGTGQYSRSRLRLVDLESGQPVSDQILASEIFGEGVTVWKDTVLQLTWRNGYLILYDAKTLKRTGSVRYSEIDPNLREGWGIAHDGHSLIISDGSADLRFVNPDTFRLERTLRVRAGTKPVSKLNELEFVNGKVFANVWYEDRIASIDPATGIVTEWIELSHLRPREVRNNREAVLNGIAWDAKSGRLFVTGKHWPKLFEISIDEGDR
jgi:glutamine cyclotransferase